MSLDILWAQLEEMRKLCRKQQGNHRRATVQSFRNAMVITSSLPPDPEAPATEEEIRSCLALDLTIEELREARNA